uniref:Coatomer subunit beta n=1 Tax=Fibrocapsa japonica TaxID=94617 RepID=A0A7S2V1X2_9STRA
MAARRAKQKEEDTQEVSEALRAQPDDLITFRQLRATRGAAGTTKELDAVMDGDDLGRAVGANQLAGQGSKLSHVYQLSGFADPVYAEALVTVHDYDIVLEILVINRTPNTLTNLTVELATMGDLKLVERPQSYTIGPLDQRTIRANIKVSSTETGHVFGTIVYENSSTAQKAYINLNDIHLDIMDYIYPSSNCTDDAFRRMWEEFEWENKVAINTSFDELSAYLSHLVAHTNMACLTPTSSLGGQSSFLAANLYAKSIFGEDVLVNVSVEKKDDADGKLSGYVRIRSKTQGIALSLGDRITLVQRGPLKATPQP